MNIAVIRCKVWGKEKIGQISDHLSHRKSLGRVHVSIDSSPTQQDHIFDLDIRATPFPNFSITNEDLGELLSLVLGGDSCFVSITGVEIS